MRAGPVRFADVYASAQRDPESFWAEAAAALEWTRPWRRVLDRSRPPFYRWFEGAELNTCYNAVDRHVAAGRGAVGARI
jgi:propionyl-CoA synthetase